MEMPEQSGMLLLGGGAFREVQQVERRRIDHERTANKRAYSSRRQGGSGRTLSTQFAQISYIQYTAFYGFR